jgi:hypothetical protein
MGVPSVANAYPLAFTRSETARIFGLCREEVDALLQSGRLRTIRIGRRELILAKSIDEYLFEEEVTFAREECAGEPVVYFEIIG